MSNKTKVARLALLAMVFAIISGSAYGAGFRAIENYCAWPNLTQLPDGTIIAAIYNQPSHGWVAGDVECWASTDGGLTWSYRGTPHPHEGSDEARCNVAAGLANNGDLIVICNGWDIPSQTWNRTWVSRSSDSGAAWTIDKTGFPLGPKGSEYILFGDILPGADGNLRVACYDCISPWDCDFLISSDDGRTWKLQSTLAVNHNETAPLHLGGGKWIAVARSGGDEHVDLYMSYDDGKRWQFNQQLTNANEHPGHLLELADGRILLSYGDRANPGVEAILSSDEGQTWSDPIRLAELGGDLGYPSSVQRADGKIVTAYYSSSGGYYMGVVIWDIPKAASSAKTGAIDVGTEKQVFMDGRFIESKNQGIELVVNRPRVTGEKLLVADNPWEDFFIGAYHSVIQDDDRIHMWYETGDRRGLRNPWAMAYAYSADFGKTWIKPNLGVIEYEGSKNNNLVLTGIAGASVFKNSPDAPASQKYCMFSGQSGQKDSKGNKLSLGFTSPDGIHWKPYGDVPFLEMRGVVEANGAVTDVH